MKQKSFLIALLLSGVVALSASASNPNESMADLGDKPQINVAAAAAPADDAVVDANQLAAQIAAVRTTEDVLNQTAAPEVFTDETDEEDAVDFQETQTESESEDDLQAFLDAAHKEIEFVTEAFAEVAAKAAQEAADLIASAKAASVSSNFTVP